MVKWDQKVTLNHVVDECVTSLWWNLGKYTRSMDFGARLFSPNRCLRCWGVEVLRWWGWNPLKLQNKKKKQLPSQDFFGDLEIRLFLFKNFSPLRLQKNKPWGWATNKSWFVLTRSRFLCSVPFFLEHPLMLHFEIMAAWKKLRRHGTLVAANPWCGFLSQPGRSAFL